ncbi:hypothetical protein RUM44_007354 [Polyplax serrata]|uniref:Ig-like domain-containing protein n=1 Tax=Polyplax serrata TaxID=468196 RepID=A0ABR1B0F8_POLSC
MEAECGKSSEGMGKGLARGGFTFDPRLVQWPEEIKWAKRPMKCQSCSPRKEELQGRKLGRRSSCPTQTKKNDESKEVTNDGPSFAISREPGFGFPLREGMAVSLKCDVDSNPPSSPIWLKGKFPGYCSVLYKNIEKPLQVSRFDDTCSSYFLPP